MRAPVTRRGELSDIACGFIASTALFRGAGAGPVHPAGHRAVRHRRAGSP